jgi:hypothetical protein
VSLALQYKTHAERGSVDDLAPGECCVRAASNAAGAQWWMLWFCFVRTDTGAREVAAVPIAISGARSENGAGGRTWGFNKTAPGTWTVSPSINVLDVPGGVMVHAGEHPTLVSVWHETPDVVYVSDGEPWQ